MGGEAHQGSTAFGDLSFLGPEQSAVISSLTHTIHAYFPQLSSADSQQLVEESFRQADLRYGLETASAWAEEFRVPWGPFLATELQGERGRIAVFYLCPWHSRW